jgi:hypothetical protein
MKVRQKFWKCVKNFKVRQKRGFRKKTQKKCVSPPLLFKVGWPKSRKSRQKVRQKSASKTWFRGSSPWMKKKSFVTSIQSTSCIPFVFPLYSLCIPFAFPPPYTCISLLHFPCIPPPHTIAKGFFLSLFLYNLFFFNFNQILGKYYVLPFIEVDGRFAEVLPTPLSNF